ncbi:MAG: PQQ-binding-like beta-propeller repeat protein, partial [Candidatus Abyssubacteria bacterium]|nr:PQQ-binding-like beta-propeller repeat protein [Candidatus Abyssubacteria bacterium]
AGGQITAAPIVDGNRVYVGSWDKHVYALDADDNGAVIWKVNTGDIISATPVLSGGTLYVTTRKGAVYALDAETGAGKWDRPTGGSGGLSPAIHGGILFMEGDRKLLAYDAATGRQLGSFPSARIKTLPIAVGDRFYYVQYDDAAGVDELCAFEIRHGLSQGKLRLILPRWGIPLANEQIE